MLPKKQYLTNSLERITSQRRWTDPVSSNNDNITLRMKAIEDVKIGNISRSILFSHTYMLADILGGDKPRRLSVRINNRLFTTTVIFYSILFYFIMLIVQPLETELRELRYQVLWGYIANWFCTFICILVTCFPLILIIIF